MCMQALGLQFLYCCVLDVDCYTSVLGVLLGQEVGRLLGAAVHQMVQGRGCSTCLVLASHKERRALWCVHAGSAAMIKVPDRCEARICPGMHTVPTA